MEQLFKKLSGIDKDKLLHSFYGTLLFVVFLYLQYSSYIAFWLVVIIALLKEIYDEYKYGGFCWKDIGFTIFIPFIFILKEFLNA